MFWCLVNSRWIRWPVLSILKWWFNSVAHAVKLIPIVIDHNNRILFKRSVNHHQWSAGRITFQRKSLSWNSYFSAQEKATFQRKTLLFSAGSFHYFSAHPQANCIGNWLVSYGIFGFLCLIFSITWIINVKHKVIKAILFNLLFEFFTKDMCFWR